MYQMTIMIMLDPKTIASTFTIEDIETQISKYMVMLDEAAEIKSYELADTQSSQKVASQDMDKIAAILNNWLYGFFYIRTSKGPLITSVFLLLRY